MINSQTDVWSMVLTSLEQDLTATTVNTWFGDCSLLELGQDQIVLHIPNNFKKNTVVERYIPRIQAALKEIFSSDFEVLVLGEGELEPWLKKEHIPATLFEGDEFTFDNFVVGSSNKFAHAAAQAVANNPAQAYNPLFIYGDSGLGKTHLLYSIAHDIRAANPGARIVYVKGDDFTNEMIESIRLKTNQEFRDRYRSADLLLVDDIQFIAGKQQTQEEFFHTFNTLYEAKRQIVLTSDRPPKEMAQLEDRLQTRFEWGLMADIQPPDYETRVAIIQNKAAQLNMNISEGAIEYIAQNMTSNVRQIEGAVKKLFAYQDLLDASIDPESTKRLIRDMFKDPAEFCPSPAVIIEEIAKYYLLEEEEIRGQSRIKDRVMARQVAMYMIRKMTKLSLEDIGKEFEDRDHTTVRHSIGKVEQELRKNNEFAETIRDITTAINAHR